MRSWRALIPIALLLLVVAALLALFWIQNSSRTTELSLDLYWVAWQLRQPVSVPGLLAACVGLGFLLGFLPMWIRAAALSRKARRLEQQLAITGGDDPDWG